MAKKKAAARPARDRDRGFPDFPEYPEEDAPETPTPAKKVRTIIRPEDVVPSTSASRDEGKPSGSEGAAGAEGGEGGESAPDEAPKRRAKAKHARRGDRKDGKHIRSARKRIDKLQRYPLNDGLSLLLEATPKRKFDETVELVVKLGIDPKKADQAIRGAISLPNGLGKEVRVIAFAEGPDAEAATAAGAIEVGGEELAKKIEGGWMEFDKAVAHPGMMKHVGKLGRVLGPQGKMPSPKDGTVTGDVGVAVKEFRLGKVNFRADDHGNVHVPVGKRSFDREKLEQNIQAFIDQINTMKPSAVKGIYLQKAVVSTTMGPGVPLAVS